MTQLNLFDQQPIARNNDKQTSHVAAAKVEPKLTAMQYEFVHCLRQLGVPGTAQEIASMTTPDIRESVRKRAAECVRLGLVKEAGERKCSVTGNLATVYWVTNGN